MRVSKTFLVLSVVVILGLVTAVPARGETRTGDQIVVGANEVVNDDLYVAGQTVTIDGTVKGDVIGAGNRITVNGKVEGDLIFAGNAIVVNGTVGDHLRAVGQVLKLGPNARVGKSAMMAGFSIETQAGSTIGGDLIAFGFQMLHAGSAGKDLLGGMPALEIRGGVARNVNVDVDSDNQNTGAQPTFFMPNLPEAIPSVPMGLTLADSAKIGGTLKYTSRWEGKINPAAGVLGGISRTIPQVTERRAAALPSLFEVVMNEVRRFFALFLFGLGMLWVVPGWTKGLAEKIRSKPLPSLGWGLITIFAFGVVLFALVFATIALTIIFGIATLGYVIPMILSIGLLLTGTVLVSFMTFIAFIADVVVGYLGGKWIVQKIRPTIQTAGIPLFVGLTLLVILTALPGIGGVIGFFVDLFALGAFWMWSANAIRTFRGRLAAPQMQPQTVGV